MALTSLGVLVVVLNALSGSPAAEMPPPFTLGDYEFIPPQGWQVQREGTRPCGFRTWSRVA